VNARDFRNLVENRAAPVASGLSMRSVGELGFRLSWSCRACGTPRFVEVTDTLMRDEPDENDVEIILSAMPHSTMCAGELVG
jgi:hypothetical protein